MNPLVRSPAVAGRFYPGDDESLRQTIRDFSNGASKGSHKQSVLAAISPHAGYVYSGAVAAETLEQIEIPETVVLLGPSHTGKGAPVALSTATWQMPMGDVPVNQEFAQDLLNESEIIVADELAHKYEHSLEVQIPFLQMAQPNLSIVPICISHLPYHILNEVGLALAEVIKKNNTENILVVASTDMTHYKPREVAEKQDHYVLEKLINMDPAIVYKSVIENDISMCGIMPVTVALIAALKLGATKTELIRYTDSGEISGDTTQVVGYAGLLIS